MIFIIILGAFLRFFKLTEFPIQLNHDEITQLYDAISIAQTGKDVYGNFLPFIFPSVGDFKPPFYTYITSFFYFIIGGGELTIRFASALFGTLLIPVVYLFTNKILDKNTALIAAFFTAIAPFEIFFSRKSFESGTGILFMMLGFWCLYKHFEKRNLKWVYSASLIFSFGMYTYFSHAIIIPFLLITFLFIYRNVFLQSPRKFLIPLFLFLILVAPIFFMILTDSDTRFRTQTVFISQDPILGKQLSLIDPESHFLRIKTTINYSFDRYLKQFDPMYLFGNGLFLTNQNLLGIGPLLFFQFPFLILGIVYLLKKNNYSNERKFILTWIIIGMIPSGLTFEEHSPHRVVMVFTMLNIISAAGFFAFMGFIAKFKRNVRFILAGFVSLVITFNVLYFFHIYFVNFPYEKSHTIQYPFKMVAQFAWSQYENVGSIVFDPKFGMDVPIIGVGAHYYLAYYGNYPPVKFQKEYRLGDKPREAIFDKFSIREVYWPEDKELKNTLVIVSPWSVPIDLVDQSKIIKRFNFYDGTLAFYAVKL